MDILGTLCSSVKQMKAPYLFDWEQGIALHAMQGNRASSLSEGEVSWFFSSCSGNVGYIQELQQGQPLTTFVYSVPSGHLSRSDGHLRRLNLAWQNKTDASGGEAEDRGSLSSWHSDIWIPNQFQEESGILTL